jgi:hypothetical protein
MDWQPIETAPKDGTLIDIWIAGEGGNTRVADVYWGEYTVWDRYPFSSHGEQGWVLEEPSENWGVCHNNAENSLAGRGRATHWMPLPEPPQ